LVGREGRFLIQVFYTLCICIAGEGNHHNNYWPVSTCKIWLLTSNEFSGVENRFFVTNCGKGLYFINPSILREDIHFLIKLILWVFYISCVV
jgi:hypothetical protein